MRDIENTDHLMIIIVIVNKLTLLQFEGSGRRFKSADSNTSLQTVFFNFRKTQYLWYLNDKTNHDMTAKW